MNRRYFKLLIEIMNVFFIYYSKYHYNKNRCVILKWIVFLLYDNIHLNISVNQSD